LFETENWHIAFPEFWECSPYIDKTRAEIFETAMRIAVTVRAIKPWGLPAIHPQSLTQAIRPLLQKIFPASPSETITLIRKFRELPQNSRFDIPGWTRPSMGRTLNSLSTVTSQNFSGLSSRCSLYYDAMMFVFSQHKMDLESVSIGLAVWCATCYFYDESYPKEMEQTNSASTISACFRAALRERLNGSPMEDLDD
jgi:hypothetical protein